MKATRVLVSGSATAEVLRLDEPLSFWGGLDVSTGIINDVHHPQFGTAITDTIVFMPFARGSSSTANALAEAIYSGTGPAGIVMLAPDEIIVLGAAVAGELYGRWIPVVVLAAADYDTVGTGTRLAIEGDLVQITS